jgi:hypothetical protein
MDPAYPDVSITAKQKVLSERALAREVISGLVDGFILQ